jgi:DNA (cytosine-5)-methyltransferase 1
VNELALFAGAGGGILGGKLLGWRTVCAVEREPYAASVLVARQNDGFLPPFPIWDDVCTFDGRPWRGRVDVVSGGFPCQDISAAGKERALTEPEADCGAKWRGSLARWDRDSSSWKTPQCSLLADLDVFSETWPRWGMMRDGECSEQSMPVLRTSETESGLWRTPMARDWKDMSCSSQIYRQDQVKMWPTPCATDHKGSGKTGTLRDRLDYAAERGATKSNTYATPQARDFRSGSTDRWDNPERTRNLNDQIGGQLNPTWVEWLMGWPLGWTDLKPLETDKFRQWQLQHGKY